MAIFSSKPFRSTRWRTGPASSFPLFSRVGIVYRRQVASHPFLFFGLPFVSLMVISSFLLTPATALRYEKHDRRNSELSTTEALSLGYTVAGGDVDGNGKVKEAHYNPRRRVVSKGGMSQKDEYYVSFILFLRYPTWDWFLSGQVANYVCLMMGTETHGKGSGYLGTETGGEMER